MEIKQYKIQGVSQDNKRTVTKQYMIICQINNIENKCYRNSEGMIALHCKSRNDTFKDVKFELRLENDKKYTLYTLFEKREAWVIEVLVIFHYNVINVI